MLPTFFVIGAEKSGTTSLHHYLDEHPEIHMSVVKEPGYFANPQKPRPWTASVRDQTGASESAANVDLVPTLDEYMRLFIPRNNETAFGESSTGYLRSRPAADGIRDVVPDAKLIAILRDPCERALSAHRMYSSQGKDPVARFSDAVDEELSGRRTNLHHLRGSCYYEDVAYYYRLFEPRQLKLFLYDELRDEPLRLLRETFEFLGVDPDFRPDVSQRFNEAVVPRSRIANEVVEQDSLVKSALKAVLPRGARTWIKVRTREWNRARPESMSPEMRRRLIEYFEDDVRRLESLIDRDLSA